MADFSRPARLPVIAAVGKQTARMPSWRGTARPAPLKFPRLTVHRQQGPKFLAPAAPSVRIRQACAGACRPRQVAGEAGILARADAADTIGAAVAAQAIACRRADLPETFL